MYLTDSCGTFRSFFSYTMAPQVLQGIYSSQADLWSIGVMSYMLLSSTKPFYSKNKRAMIDLIMRGKVSFDGDTWKNVSEDAKDFVRQLLVVNPKQRMDGPEALQHPWIVDREQLPNELPSPEVLAAVDAVLLNYGQTSPLKKLALTVIAHRSTAKDVLHLRKVFDSFDTVKNGYLSYEEFKAALEKMDFTGDDLDEIFTSIVSALWSRCVLL